MIFIISTSYQMLFGRCSKENEMGIICRTYRKKDKSAFRVYLWVNLNEKDNLENQGVDRK